VAGGFSKLVKATSSAGVPYAEPASAALERAGEVAKGLFSSTSLAKRKSEIVDALRLLSRRIIVFVDDLDRLEPREASEMLRLIRAVADFPNVIYVLSCDTDALAKTLQKSVQVDDGRAYLEKIIQVSFRVPRPEAFDLRRWFQDQIGALFANALPQSADPQRPPNQRLANAIDVHGGRYLQTPRDVVRAINALRLHAIPVIGNIDIADMVWLQLVRLGNPTLYAWIEEYLTETSALYHGAGITDNSAERMGRRLDDILTQEGVDLDRARFDLRQLLPGISPQLGFGADRDARRVYNNLRREAYHELIVERRLGSPEHYRLYFAFAQPSGALGDDQVAAFIELAQRDVDAVVRMFADLAGRNRPQGGVMAEVLVERLLAAIDQVPATAVPGIFASLAATLDAAALSTRDGAFGQHRAWGSAERAVELLLRKVPDEQRAECIRRIFDDGRSLGWITSILRSEIFAHGHYGDRTEPPENRLLNAVEFEQARTTMLRRFAVTPPADLMNVPNLVSLLYGWKQASGNDDARTWVEANTRADDGLLAFLARARGWLSSSDDGIQYPLNRRDLSNFLDYDAAVRRVRAIAEDIQAAPERRQTAQELLLAFQQGQGD